MTVTKLWNVRLGKPARATARLHMIEKLFGLDRRAVVIAEHPGFSIRLTHAKLEAKL